MCGDESWGFACCLNPDGKDAGIFTVWGFDLALDGELFAVPRDLDFGDSLASTMSPKCFGKRFPIIRLESSLKEELRFRSSVFVGKVEQVGREFALFDK